MVLPTGDVFLNIRSSRCHIKSVLPYVSSVHMKTNILIAIWCNRLVLENRIQKEKDQTYSSVAFFVKYLIPFIIEALLFFTFCV